MITIEDGVHNQNCHILVIKNPFEIYENTLLDKKVKRVFITIAFNKTYQTIPMLKRKSPEGLMSKREVTLTDLMDCIFLDLIG